MTSTAVTIASTTAGGLAAIALARAQAFTDGAIAPLVLDLVGREVGPIATLLVLFGILLLLCAGMWAITRRTQHRAERLRRLAEERALALEAEKERLQEALATVEEQSIQLLRMDHVKSRLFADLSHEFRTPLTLILAPLDRAASGEMGDLAEEERHGMELARANALRLLRLTNQLLDLARIEAGCMELHAREADLVPFLVQATDLFSSEAERREVGLEFRHEDGGARAFFDPEKLEKVLYNLIANALRATAPGGKILITLTQVPPSGEGPGWAEIKVRDTGCGIAPDQLPHIFDRFYQGESGRTGGGTGIGLSLAKELVEIHGGEITVASTPGFGSTFTIRLPLGREHLADHEVAAAPSPKPAFSALELQPEGMFSPEPGEVALDDNGGDGQTDDRALVLVVEDNADVRRLVAAHLESRYRVIHAADGETGLCLARELRPDLVVSDVVLPGMCGLELCRRIKQDERLGGTPVILLTARASDASRLEGLQTGADDYITKPFSGDELLTRAENLLRTRASLRRRFSQEVVLQPTGAALQSADAAFMQRVYEAVDGHLAQEDFSVRRLAGEVGVSESGLKRRLKAIAGQPPVEFIRNRRLDRAAEMLAARTGSVSEVAMAVGFGSASYFAKCFRQRFGILPSAYAEEAATTPP